MASFPQRTQNEVERLSTELLVHDAAGVTNTGAGLVPLCHEYIQDSETIKGISPALTPLLVLPVLAE